MFIRTYASKHYNGRFELYFIICASFATANKYANGTSILNLNQRKRCVRKHPTDIRNSCGIFDAILAKIFSMPSAYERSVLAKFSFTSVCAHHLRCHASWCPMNKLINASSNRKLNQG